MPDLDSELTELGSKLRESARPPHVSDVIERAHSRRQRRRTQLATAIVVALVALAIPLLRSSASRTPAVNSLPGPKTSLTPSVDFFDATHGYAMWSTCLAHACTSTVQVTQDGKTWQRLDLLFPGFGKVKALGPHTLIVDTADPPSVTRRFSNDAGQTWHEVPRTPTGSVAEIPAGAILEMGCDAACPQPDIVGVVLPDSGLFAPLATQPPFGVSQAQAIPDADGTWRVLGLKDTGDWILGTSRDNGRSWQVSTLPAAENTADGAEVEVLARPDAVYAMVMHSWAGPYRGLTAIFRSTDHGQTWEQTWQAPAKDNGRWLILAAPEVRPDGTLAVLTPDKKLHTSKDNGHTFQDSDLTPESWPGIWTRGGYLTGPALTGMPSGAYPYRLDGVAGEVPRP
jgi:BNR/Asp-box repeat protein